MGNKNTCFAHQPQRSYFLVVYLLVAMERPICWVESSKAHLSFWFDVELKQKTKAPGMKGPCAAKMQIRI
jgi:hypothetical protein